MKFSKAIQIKGLVNRWNENRRNDGYGYVKFEASMCMDGHWSVGLKLVDSFAFTSQEMEEFITLYAGGGFRMSIFAYDKTLIIDML